MMTEVRIRWFSFGGKKQLVYFYSIFACSYNNGHIIGLSAHYYRVMTSEELKSSLL